jgi:hypothetical protein
MAVTHTSTIPAPLACDHGLAEAKCVHNSRYPVEEGFENPIIISPYVEAPHLLDLQTLEPQAQLLAWALRELRSVREDHATAPYVDIFNWTEVIATLRQLVVEKGQTWREQMFYIVVFRSQIPPTTDYTHLGVLDKEAHAEAMKSGGFLKSVPTSPHNVGIDIIIDTGLEAQIALGGISQHASGGIEEMPGLVASGQLIDERQEQHGICTLNGLSTVSDS